MALLLLLSSPSFAERENKLESWYTYWGWGYAKIYPDNLNKFYYRTEGKSFGGLSVDLFGLYLPLGRKTLAGGIMNLSSTSWEYYYGPKHMVGSRQVVEVRNYLLGSSFMCFPQYEIGRGMLLRADVGLAWHGSRGTYGDRDYSDAGIGFLLGIGYGYPMTPGTRLLLNVNFVRRIVEGDVADSIALTLNGLF